MKNNTMDNKYLTLQRDFYVNLGVELRSFKNYALSNIGVIITALYFVGSIAGLLYLNILLEQFDVNVFNHIELSDYLSALLSNGTILVLITFFLITFSGVMSITLKREQKVKRNTWYNRLTSMLSMPFYLLSPLLSLVLASIMALFIFSWEQADRDAADIKSGFSEAYSLTLIYPIKLESRDVTQLNSVSLVTSTNANLFVYNRESEQLVIVPHSNVAALVPILSRNAKTVTENSEESSVKR